MLQLITIYKTDIVKMIKLPAGKYVVSDPCYVLKRDDFVELMDSSYDNDGELKNEDGGKAVVFSTAHGDGSYDSNKSHSFPVDAGVIAIIPIGQCDDEMLSNSLANSACLVVDFKKEFTCSIEDGEMTFGDLIIYTDPKSDCGLCGDIDCDGDTCESCGDCGCDDNICYDCGDCECIGDCEEDED